MRKTVTISAAVVAMCALLILGSACVCSTAPQGRYGVAYAVVEVQPPVDDEGEPERLSLKNDGTNKSITDVVLKETRGKDAAVNMVVWTLYDADGAELAGGAQVFMPPEEIEGGKEITVSIENVSYEHFDPWAGLGSIKLEAQGYDATYGSPIGSIPGYVEANVYD
jgi:hypothetical protein